MNSMFKHKGVTTALGIKTETVYKGLKVEE